MDATSLCRGRSWPVGCQTRRLAAETARGVVFLRKRWCRRSEQDHSCSASLSLQIHNSIKPVIMVSGFLHQAETGQGEEASYASCAGAPSYNNAPPLNVVGQLDFCLRASGLLSACCGFSFVNDRAEQFRRCSFQFASTCMPG